MSQYNLFTIGHSTYPIEQFLYLLKKHDINFLIDVRSKPFSSWNPHFSLQELKGHVNSKNIEYSWYGKQLGGLGKTSIKSDEYEERIGRVLMKLDRGNIAIMCSEKDPKMCHRASKLTPSFNQLDIKVTHILEHGTIEDQYLKISPKKMWHEHDERGQYGKPVENSKS